MRLEKQSDSNLLEDFGDLYGLATAVAETPAGGESPAWAEFWTRAQPTLERWVRSPGFLGRVSARDDYCRDIVMLAWEKLQDNDYNKLRMFSSRRAERRGGEIGDAEGDRRAFKAWLFRVFKNIGIDYMRQLPEFVRRTSRRPPAVGGDDSDGSGHSTGQSERVNAEDSSDDYWRAMVTLHSEARPIHATYTSAATAQQLLDFLDQSISPRQRAALELHDRGASDQDIAEAIGLSDPDDARRVIDRSLDRRRYRRALELWSQNFSREDIAEALGLDDPQHAQRIVNAAKELLKRHFR